MCSFRWINSEINFVHTVFCIVYIKKHVSNLEMLSYWLNTVGSRIFGFLSGSFRVADQSYLRYPLYLSQIPCKWFLRKRQELSSLTSMYLMRHMPVIHSLPMVLVLWCRFKWVYQLRSPDDANKNWKYPSQQGWNIFLSEICQRESMESPETQLPLDHQGRYVTRICWVCERRQWSYRGSVWCFLSSSQELLQHWLES